MTVCFTIKVKINKIILACFFEIMQSYTDYLRKFTVKLSVEMMSLQRNGSTVNLIYIV